MGAMKDDDAGIDDLPKAENHEAVEEVSELGGEKICQIERRFETFVRQVKQTITKMLQTSLSCQLGKIQSGSWATLDNTYQSAKASYQLRASCLQRCGASMVVSSRGRQPDAWWNRRNQRR